MTLLEYYLNPGTAGINAGSSTTILGITQWKPKFVSGAVRATGTSTVTTTTTIEFLSSLSSAIYSVVSYTTTSTVTQGNAQQYPAGNGNGFSPLVNNILESITVIIENNASVDNNFALFCVEIDLDGEFDE